MRRSPIPSARPGRGRGAVAFLSLLALAACELDPDFAVRPLTEPPGPRGVVASADEVARFRPEDGLRFDRVAAVGAAVAAASSAQIFLLRAGELRVLAADGGTARLVPAEIPGTPAAAAASADGTALFVATGSELRRISTKSGQAEWVLARTGPVGGVAVDRLTGQVYWAEPAGIFRAPATGASVEALVAAPGLPRGLAFDGTRRHLYAIRDPVAVEVWAIDGAGLVFEGNVPVEEAIALAVDEVSGTLLVLRDEELLGGLLVRRWLEGWDPGAASPRFRRELPEARSLAALSLAPPVSVLSGGEPGEVLIPCSRGCAGPMQLGGGDRVLPDGALVAGRTAASAEGALAVAGAEEVLLLHPALGLVDRFPLPGRDVADLEFAPDGTLYVLDAAAPALLALTATGVQEVTSGGLLGAPGGIAVLSDSRLVVADRSGTLVHVEAATGAQAVLPTAQPLAAPGDVEFDGGRLLVADAGPSASEIDDLETGETAPRDGSVVAVDPDTGAVTPVQAGLVNARAVGVAADGAWLVVDSVVTCSGENIRVCNDSSTASRIDPATLVATPLAGGDYRAEDILAFPVLADGDHDGVPDAADSCPRRFDPTLRDTDGDGAGDVCDPCPLSPDPPDAAGVCSGDADADGVPDAADLCPLDPDPAQGDADGDGVGDACDNCRLVPNPAQVDLGAPGDEDPLRPGVQRYGNACDPDLDDDGVVGASDFFARFLPCFGLAVAAEPACGDADLDVDGRVALPDFFGRMRPAMGGAPGPGAIP